MTDRLDELQRLHEAATKGPWRADVTPPGPCGQVLRNESVVADYASRDIVLVARRGTTHGVQWFKDASYIAAMRNALPALLRVARAAKHLRTAMTTSPKGYGDEHQGYWWTAATEKAAEEVAEAFAEMEREP